MGKKKVYENEKVFSKLYYGDFFDIYRKVAKLRARLSRSQKKVKVINEKNKIIVLY